MLNNDVIKVLEELVIDNDEITLPKQLDRKLYLEVNEILEALGGKWNKKCHKFNYNPSLEIKDIIKTKIKPPKNPHAFFPTPKDIVKLMINYSDIYFDCKILEPNIGTGNIALEILKEYPNAKITGVEIDPLKIRVCKEKLEGKLNIDFIQDDFLNFKSDKLFDRIIMNPPFAYEGYSKAYIEHIYHAWAMLAENGILITITPKGWLSNSSSKEKQFYEFVMKYNDFYDELEPGTFKESGTMTTTMLVKLIKNNLCLSSKYNGFPNYNVFNFVSTVESNYNIYQEMMKIINDSTKLRNFLESKLRYLNVTQYLGVYLEETDWNYILNYWNDLDND